MRGWGYIVMLAFLSGCATPRVSLLTVDEPSIVPFHHLHPTEAAVYRIRSGTYLSLSISFVWAVGEYNPLSVYWVNDSGDRRITPLVWRTDIDNAHLGQGDGVLAVSVAQVAASSPALIPGQNKPVEGSVEALIGDGHLVVMWADVADVRGTLRTDGAIEDLGLFPTRALEAVDWGGTLGVASPVVNLHVARSWKAEGSLFGYIKVFRPSNAQGEILCSHATGEKRISLKGPDRSDAITYDQLRWVFSLDGPLDCTMTEIAGTGAKVYLVYLTGPPGMLPYLDVDIRDNSGG